MIAFHVTLDAHEIGAVLRPERHARQYRQFRPGGPMPTPEDIASVLWEIAFETARKGAAPRKPSRLDSLFAWESQDAATSFLRRSRAGGRMLRIEVPDDAPIHRGDFDLYSHQMQGSYVDYMSDIAVQYWLEEPRGAVELVIAAPVTVAGVV